MHEPKGEPERRETSRFLTLEHRSRSKKDAKPVQNKRMRKQKTACQSTTYRGMSHGLVIHDEILIVIH